MYQDVVFIRHLGLQPYESVLKAMRNFTDMRNKNTADEIWLVEHLPVFTQGKTGKEEHLLISSSNIPIIQSDRGGQVTYHGPGQQIMYVLLDLRRRKISARELVKWLEQAVVNTLAEYGIDSYSRSDAPGIYVRGQKICSLGLCIRKGCSYHGLALNVNMDLSPFLYINPCGYVGMKTTQMRYWDKTLTPNVVYPYLIKHFLMLLNNSFRECQLPSVPLQ